MKVGLSILCVDDHPDSVDLMQLVLENEGHKVTAALTAEKAIEHLQRQEFDLYILDLQIPGVDGLALCRKIRSSDLRVPIIMYSAAAYMKDKDAGYDAGATAFITKPDGIDQIIAIAAHLRESNNAAPKFHTQDQHSI